MMRNDYRRALILLRGNAPGYSGHVRLERRTLMGSMYFQVQAPVECELMRAALVGKGRGDYFACSLGELPRDGRGQAVLSYNFDPRNICGHELEDYQLIAVSCGTGENCEILIYGNVCGHADLNWDRVRTAVCSLYCTEAEQENISSEPDAPVQSRRIENEIIEEIDDLRDEIADACEGGSDPEAEVLDELNEEIEGVPKLLQDGEQSAAELLDLDIDLPWPAEVEALRSLFMYSPPLKNPPDEEYIYIAAPMPDESGFAYVAVGIRVEDGEPVSVRYALPSRWSEKSPAGLEEYIWVGDGNTGWWVSEFEIHPDGAI